MKRMSVDRANEEQLRRLAMGISIIEEAKGIPRRLGGEANDQELAEDKLTCRRVLHRLTTMYEEWNEGTLDGIVLPAARGKGARLQWPVWWQEWQKTLQEWLEFYEEKDAHARYPHRIRRELEGLEQCF